MDALLDSTLEEVIKISSEKTEEQSLLFEHPDPSLQREITRIYEIVRSDTLFPSACRVAARHLELLGLPVVHGGLFHVDIPKPNGQTSVVHSWGYDQQERIIELTGIQFNKLMNLGRQFPEGIVIIPPKHELYKLYENDIPEIRRRMGLQWR